MTKEIICSFAIKTLFSIVGLFITALISRTFSQSETGVIFTMISMIAVLSAFNRGGLETIIARRSSAFVYLNSFHSRLLFSSFIIVFCFSLFASGVFLTFNIFSPVISSIDNNIKLFVYIASIFDAMLLVAIRIFQGIGKPQLFLLLALSQKIGLLCTLLVLSLLSLLTIETFIFGYIVSTILPLYFQLKKLKLCKARFLAAKHYLGRAKSLIKESVPIFIVGIANAISQHSGIFVIGILLTNESVAAYGILHRVASVAGFFAIASNTVLAPYFSREYRKNGITAAYSLYIEACKKILFIGAPFFSLVILFSDYILAIFGQEYVVHNKLLILMLVAQLVNVVTGSMNTFLIMTKKTKIYKNINLINILAGLALMFLLVSTWKLTGAGVAYALSIIILNGTMFLTIRIIVKNEKN